MVAINPFVSVIGAKNNRALFNWLSMAITWLRLLRLVIGLEISTNENQNQSQGTLDAHSASYRYLLRILIGSSHSLLLLWLVRVVTLVMFLSTTIWKPLFSKLFTGLGWEQVPLHFPDKNQPFKSATDSATASSGGGSMALLKNSPISPSLRSLMVRASSWRGVRRISGVACSASLSKCQHSWS